jgi:glutathione synthase
MRFVYVMDPMDRLLPDKDTTVAFLRASQARGHTSLHCEARDLYLKDGDVYARTREVKVSDGAAWFTHGAPAETRVADAQAVFIRKDPPFDAAYLYLTLMLERARGRTVIMNDPRGLRDANEKLYTTHFARHMPRTLVASDRQRILDFVTELGGEAVIKPLDGAGGAGILRISNTDQNTRSIIDILTREGHALAMVQQYLPAVREGDKRVLLLAGEVLGAINRVPRADDIRSNIHVGGRVEPTTVSEREQGIIRDIAPRLVQDGLHFVGLDMIGEKLTEVNVTSPTGIQELSRHTGQDVADRVIAWVEKQASDYRPSLRSIPGM